MQPLLAGPRAGLTEEQVLGAIGSPSPMWRHGVSILDGDLNDTGQTLPLDLDAGGEVAWSFRPSAPDAGATETVGVRRTGRLTTSDAVSDGDLLSSAFRVWTKGLAPDGTWVRFNLLTGVATLPSRSDDGTKVAVGFNVAPLEHLWATRTLDDWETVAADDPVLDVIRDDLDTVFGVTQSAFPTPEGDGTLGEDMTFPAGTSYLSKWTRLLNGVGCDQPTTTAAGTPTSRLLADLAGKGPEWTYAPGAGRVVVAGSVDPLDPEVPNVARYVARRGPTLPEEGNGWVTLRNESSGPASIAARGFEVFRLVQADASNQEELEAFAAADAQRLFAGGGLRAQVRVGLNPLHDDRDVVRLVRPRLGLSGVWWVTGWRWPIGRFTSAEAATMSLSAELRVDVSEVE